MFRVVCGHCGLSATQIVSGDLGVTSFDVEDCVRRCDKGREARFSDDPVAASVAKCPHLCAALAMCGKAPAQTGPLGL
jgi:hypothetical protein